MILEPLNPTVHGGQSRFIDVGGPVHFLDFGGSGPPMVLVHGLGGSAINWLGVGAALARRARVVAIDLPGFGRTPLAGRSTGLAAQRSVLARFLDGVIGGPAIVVGNSMGGLIAMMQAADEPGRVSRLVLAAPAQPWPAWQRIDLEVLGAFALYSVPGLGGWYVRRRWARLGPRGLVSDMLRICCADPARVASEIAEAHVELAAERLEGMPWAAGAFLEAARSTVATLRRRRAFYAMASRISAPVLLLQGGVDRLVPLEASRALSRARPDWTFEVFEDLGHVAPLEDPARFVDTVQRWLADVRGAGPPRAAL
jgi:glycerol-3-phosphate dehydrogenase